MYLLNFALLVTGVIIEFVQRSTPWSDISLWTVFKAFIPLRFTACVSDLFVPFASAALFDIAAIPLAFVLSHFKKEKHHANSASPLSDLHRNRGVRGSEAGI